MTPLSLLQQGFSPLTRYQPADASYRLLPFRYMRWGDDEILLTNDAGEHAFVSNVQLAALVQHRLDREDPSFLDLKAKHFLTDTGLRVPLELLATKYRTKKAFLNGGARLHLFVVTLRCDHSCRYCQVSRVSEDRERYDMSQETAARAVDLMFRTPAQALKVEFQGGEPLLCFDLVRWLVERIEARNLVEQRDLQFVVTTNLAPLTDEMLSFCRDHSVLLSTSLDGPEALHNANRPRPGRDAYALTVAGIDRAQTALGFDRVSAMMTTTRMSLAYPREIVDEYVRRGFTSIFLRPISPYGFAVRTGEAAKYETDEFLKFYRAALDHVIALNRRGVSFVEVYATLLLRKILTPFATAYVDLQSPVGTSVVAYNYDGDVYATDEGRMLAAMGDTSFRLGNVHEHGYEEIFGGSKVQALLRDSVIETLPGCSDCAFLPYCGSDPVFHYRTQGDSIGHRPNSAFCHKNMSVLRHLFGLLRGGDPFTRALLASWASGVSMEAAPS